jgi:hypothetical protein
MSKVFSLSAIRKVSARRPPGYVEDVLSHGTVEGDKVILSDEAYAELVAKYRGPSAVVPKSIKERPLPPPPGPGTELKALLKKVGIVASPGCSCNKRAMLMDENEAKEPGWCEKNLETICDWLQEEAGKRKLPFVRMAAKILVRQAIRNARKKGQ